MLSYLANPGLTLETLYLTPRFPAAVKIRTPDFCTHVFILFYAITRHFYSVLRVMTEQETGQRSA
jgi:hypothetical protein